MAEDLLLRYAKSSYQPHERARDFLLRDPRFSWAQEMTKQQPRADVVLAGAGLRDVMLGIHPETMTATISGANPKDVRRFLTPYGNLDVEGSEHVLTFTPRDQSGDVPAGRLYVLVGSLPPRDFTIDSLLYSTKRGTLHDQDGGLADLHERRIRVPGYPLRTFADDPLRMLRALRLAAERQLGFADETWHALTCSLPRLNRIHRNEAGAPEYAYPRSVLGSALMETLAADPRYGSTLVEHSGLGSLVAPELFADAHEPDSAWNRSRRALDVLLHSDTMAGFRLAGISAAMIVAALFMYHERNSTLARDLVHRFHLHQFPKGHSAHLTADDVMWLLENLKHFHEHDPASMTPSAFEKIFGSERGRSLLALMHAMFLTNGQHHVARERLHVARRLLDSLGERAAELPKLVRGRDLSILGVRPGPLYRDLMKKVRDAQLSGRLATRDDALAFLQLHVGKM